ncbi:MAG TPA: polysaccharide biosynthesis/export family protein, partial [Fibrobacteraceae bacterium]|nr:polysaccharide biosynthesis/export family protein [Fibrobacteraceae bacterium]
MFKRLLWIFFAPFSLWAASMGSLNFSGISESPTTSEGPSSRDQVVLTPIILEGLVDSNYIVGSGDFFELIVESSNLSVQVSPEGNVALEQAGVVNVGGVTLAEAKRRILSLLSKRYLASECYIKLAQLKKFRVGVYGSVYSSGQQVVDGGTRVSALLRQAGGLTTFGNLDSVLLLRKGDTLVLHMEQIDLTGDIHQDPLLQQGDFVFVPKLNLTGDVIYIRMESMTRAFPWKKGKTLMTYLQQSNLLKGAPNQFTHLQLINSKTQEITMVPMEQAYQLVPEPGMVLVPFWLTYDVFVGGATMTMGRV